MISSQIVQSGIQTSRRKWICAKSVTFLRGKDLTNCSISLRSYT